METRTYTSIQEESTIVERVARIVSSVRGTKVDYTRLATELEGAIPFDIFGVVLLRHDRQAVRVTVCRRERGAWASFRQQHPLAGSMFEQVLTSPMLKVRDYPNGLDGPPATCGDALSGSPQVRATLIVPLQVEDRVLGTLELGSFVAGIYADQTRQRLVSAVARVLATAIEGVQLGGNAAIQDRQRQVLKDVTSALTSRIDLSTILDRIVTGIAGALNVAAVIIMPKRDEEKGCKVKVAQAGLDQVVLERIIDCDVLVKERCILGETLQHRQPLVSQDIAHDDLYPESRVLFTELGVRSVFCYPLVTGTTIFGVLLLCSPEPGGFTPLKSDIFSLFASQATVAIHNGMLLESAHQRSRFQEAIERLERAHAQQRADSGPLNGTSVGHQGGVGSEEQGEDELALLAYVREETQRTFGVSFVSLLHFISDHLLTQGERDLRAMIAASQSERGSELERIGATEVVEVPGDREQDMRDMEASGRQGGFADPVSVLTQMAEAALVRTGMVGELSRLIMQLKQSTARMKDAWIVVDLQGNCAYMNPAAEALCEMHMEDVAVTYNPQLFVPAQRQQGPVALESLFAKLLARMRHADEVWSYLHNFTRDFTQDSFRRQELRCAVSMEPVRGFARVQERLPGESAPSDYHYQLIRHPLCNQDGLLVANALQVSDVTEQVRDENNRAALFSSVSHDLRTPLTTIKAAVTGLLQEDVAWSEGDRRAMLEDIDSEADHLTVLVNALVELSRIEIGGLVLEKEWCDVVEVVHGTLAKMRRTLANRQVCTICEVALPLVYADHAQLERVFTHLIENAAGRSSGGAEVIVKLDVVGNVQRGMARDMLRVEVIDQGGRIPEHERERIFKSFYSLRTYGNGLGLAICKGIIEAHQGSIWVDAADVDETGGSEGACFVFALPINPHTLVHGEQETPSALTGEVIDGIVASSQQGRRGEEGEGL